jgi:hypothetical protein
MLPMIHNSVSPALLNTQGVDCCVRWSKSDVGDSWLAFAAFKPEGKSTDVSFILLESQLRAAGQLYHSCKPKQTILGGRHHNTQRHNVRIGKELNLTAAYPECGFRLKLTASQNSKKPYN